MATLTAKAAGGKWGVASTWEPEQVPTAADDVILASTSGNVEVTETAKARSIEASAYKKSWTITNQKIEIGTSTSNGGLALRLGPSMTLSVAGATLKYVSTSSEEQKITTAGKSVPKQVFEGAGGKWALQDKLSSASNIELVSGTLNTNGQEVTCSTITSSGAVQRALILGASVVKLTATGSCLSLTGTELTLTPGTSTIEITDTTATAKKCVGARTYNGITVSGNNVELQEANTFALLSNNTARKPGAIKATLVEKSNIMTVTEGALPQPGEELKGASVPTGTTVLKLISAEAKTVEMSAEATTSVISAEAVEVFPVGLVLKKGVTQTAAAFSCNGTEAEPARICSSTAGSVATLKLPADLEVSAYQRTKDLKVEGAILYLPHGTDLGGNTNVKFEAKPGVTLGLGAAVIVSAASLAVMAATGQSVQPAASASGSVGAITSAATLPLALAAVGSAGASEVMVKTGIGPAPVPGESGASGAVASATTVPVQPAGSASAGAAKLTAPASLPLVAGSSASTAVGALTASSILQPAGAESSSAGSAALAAPTQIPLSGASSISAGAMSFTVPGSASLSLQSASSASTAAFSVSAAIRLALEVVAAQSASQAQVTAMAQLSLVTASGASSAALALTAVAGLFTGPAVVSSSATGTVVISVKAVPLELAPAPSASSASGVLRTAAGLALGSSTGTSSGVLSVSMELQPGLIVLIASRRVTSLSVGVSVSSTSVTGISRRVTTTLLTGSRCVTTINVKERT